MKHLGGIAVAALLVVVGCVQPDTQPSAVPSSRATVDAAEVDRRRAITRAQFEAAEKGEKHPRVGSHAWFNCPHCVDPLKGVIPDDALIDGPMPVWY